MRKEFKRATVSSRACVTQQDSKHNVTPIHAATVRVVAKNVLTLARHRGLNQLQLAEEIGVSLNVIKQMITKYRMTHRSLDKVRLWAKKCQVELLQSESA